MGKIIENNSIVKIEYLKPNDYNPKPDYKESEDLKGEFDKIKSSLSVHGQIDPVLVRQLEGDNNYEIVNGYHRWCAMKELGFTNVEIKNLGVITRDDAIRKTLSAEELKIPLDIIEVAKLVSELKKIEGGLVGLPYTEMEIQAKIDLIKFNWDEFQEKEIEIIEEGSNEIKRLEKLRRYYFVVEKKDMERLLTFFKSATSNYSLNTSKLLEITKEKK